MPDHHHHGQGCAHENHDHEHDNQDVGPKDNLFPYIDRTHVVALNATVPGSGVIKPWNERTSEDVVWDSNITLYSPTDGAAVFGIGCRRTAVRFDTASYTHWPVLSWFFIKDHSRPVHWLCQTSVASSESRPRWSYPRKYCLGASILMSGTVSLCSIAYCTRLAHVLRCSLQTSQVWTLMMFRTRVLHRNLKSLLGEK